MDQQRLQRLMKLIHLFTPPLLACAALLSACGGGLGNPPDVQNGAAATGEKLSFAYFQKCVQPLLENPIPAPNGAGTNTCASGGCHSNANGTGGALRIISPVSQVDLNLGPDAIRATDMYRNFYSAMGVTVPGDAASSRLLLKPLVQGVLHGGGQILASDTDPVAVVLRYWIEHPAPAGQDEFSTATYGMFTPADPVNGTCNTQ
jgi:hypothetical protein